MDRRVAGRKSGGTHRIEELKQLPGSRLKTIPTDLRPIKQMRVVRFDGHRYVLFRDVLASE
jgi:hypothetical protein